jgi:hypothetical protein
MEYIDGIPINIIIPIKNKIAPLNICFNYFSKDGVTLINPSLLNIIAVCYPQKKHHIHEDEGHKMIRKYHPMEIIWGYHQPG